MAEMTRLLRVLGTSIGVGGRWRRLPPLEPIGAAWAAVLAEWVLYGGGGAG